MQYHHYQMKKKKIQKKAWQKNLINFHSVPKFFPLSIMAIQIPRPLEDHHQQKMVKTHPPTHFFSSLPLHLENTHHISLGFFASLRVFEFWLLESFQACMQHKTCFKWPIDPWIPLKSLLGKTYLHHWSWRELTIWEKTLTIFYDKIMDVVLTRASFA
jgi:hypothetical protein